MKLHIKKKLSNICLLLVSTLVAILVGEFTIRQFNKSKTWTSWRESADILKTMINDAKVGYIRNPDTSYIGSLNAVCNINSMGFRDSNYNVRKGKNKKRICFIGDSVTEGYGIEVPQRYSNLTAVKANSLAQNNSIEYESLNFGISRYATSNELAVLKNYVLPMAPDIVFLQICFNDIAPNKEYDLSLPIKGLPNLDDETEDYKNFFVKIFLQKHSALYLLLAEKYNYIRLKSGKSNSILDDVLRINADDMIKTNYFIEEIKKVCSGNKIRLIASYIPLEAEVIIKSEEMSFHINNMLENTCKLHNIEYLNTLKIFRQIKDDLYLDDCHLNTEGNKIVSELISEIL
ncbi:MAG: SGNH/GDSL hydrolase family protein [Bacteroidia bacterium]